MTFEHIPPKRCYNDNAVRTQVLNDILRNHKISKKFPKGLGADHLCQQCNGDTAKWYGSPYSELVEQGLNYFHKIPERMQTNLSLPFTAKWLEATKQIATMLIAVNPEHSTRSKQMSALRSAVRNPLMAVSYQETAIFMYLTRCTRGPRLNELQSSIRTSGGTWVVDAEIAFKPFGFVMVDTNSRPFKLARSLGMFEITNMLYAAPRQTCTRYLNLPILEPQSAVSLEYA